MQNKHYSSSNYTWVVCKILVVFVIACRFSDMFAVLNAQVPDYEARVIYRLGYELLQRRLYPTLTFNLWSTARDIYPLSGHLWVELASMQKYEFHNDDVARQILIKCMHSYDQFNDYPASQCSKELRNFDEISIPGTFYSNVMNGL